jgi:hypothetical protein
VKNRTARNPDPAGRSPPPPPAVGGHSARGGGSTQSLWRRDALRLTLERA